MVERAKEHIHEGNIFQIVLSNRLSVPFEGSLLNTYRILRTINPSPYMFYFSGTDVEAVSYTHLDVYKRQRQVYGTEKGLDVPGDREEKPIWVSDGWRSVSYTHLDVYKRQLGGWNHAGSEGNAS